MNYLNSRNHEDIQLDQSSLGFISRAGTSYTPLNCEYYNVPTDEQKLDYTLNANGIVQINDVLIKVTEDNIFLLTLKVENLEDPSYQDLIEGVYDENKMNKFVTERLESDDFDLFGFIETTPYGYEETTAPVGNRRKMFGTSTQVVTQWVPSGTPGTCYIWQSNYHTTYFFWINTGSHWGDDIPNSGHYGPCPN